MNLPSGEICAPAISGSSKNTSRSMSGGRLARWAAGAAVGVVLPGAAWAEGSPPAGPEALWWPQLVARRSNNDEQAKVILDARTFLVIASSSAGPGKHGW